MTTEQAPESSGPEEEQRRESGMPGGGVGRVEEVGRSGVYPASGPLPPGDAAVRTQAEWGQGERGVEGYEDHGWSEVGLPGDEQAIEGATGGSNAGPTDATDATVDEPTQGHPTG